ncbi:MAG: helix-turn-helix transcriptional regulator [Bacteroidales bacterium]|nr:helix-turn-helix transcriptional regulator [Bacteroidales bacterium]
MVHELRTKKGIQAKQLAIDIGVSPATVSDWEHGRKNPTGTRLKKLADYFNVDEGFVLGYGVENPDLFVPENPKVCGVSETEQIVQHVLEKLNIAGPQPQTEEAKIFVKGIDKLPQEERRQLLDMARLMFKNVFDGEEE